MSRYGRWAMATLGALALLACDDDGSGLMLDGGPIDPAVDGALPDGAMPDGPAPGAAVEYLDPARHLIRASMVLRGVRPTADELDTVLSDPEMLSAFVADYVETPEFGEAVRDLENETLLLRAELFQTLGNGSLEGLRPSEVHRALTESPLRTIEWVVMNDRPYTDIVQVDFQVGDGQAALVWQGLAEYDPDGPEHQPLAFVDGRPAAGILSDGALSYRHRSAGINFHRGRANAVSRALLCFDFLSQDIVLDEPIDLSDPEAIAHAVVEDPSCVSCHQALDPLASFFWVNKANWGAGQLQFPLEFHSPRRTEEWRTATGRAPGYFGLGGTTLDDLGAHMAADPRFAQCAVRRYFAYFAQVPLDAVPFEVIAPLQQVFVESGYSAKALAVSIVLTDAFRVSHTADEAQAEGLVGLKKARPGQLDRLFHGLTGLTWQTELPGARGGIIDLATSDFYGFRVLGGGIDAYFVQQPVHTINTTASLFLQAIALQAASKVAGDDLSLRDPDQRRLLRDLPADDFTGEEAVRMQLARLHLMLFGEPIADDSAEVDESWALFAALLAEGGDAERAWALTLAALFQDLRVAYY